MESSTWWQDFFSGLILDALRLYSDEQTKTEQTKTEADFLVQTLSPAPGAHIADIPCGTGRLALALAARGFVLRGVDIAAPLVEDARRVAMERGLTATFEQREMRDLPWQAEFDHAFCFGNSFAYFDDAGNIAFLRAIYRILKPGGTFLLETHLAAESILTQPLQRRWYESGDLICLHETKYDASTGQLTSGYTLIRNSEIERKQAVYRIYTWRELQRMFSEVGFTEVEGYGSLKREPFELGSPGLWILATRA